MWRNGLVSGPLFHVDMSLEGEAEGVTTLSGIWSTDTHRHGLGSTLKFALQTKMRKKLLRKEIRMIPGGHTIETQALASLTLFRPVSLQYPIC